VARSRNKGHRDRHGCGYGDENGLRASAHLAGARVSQAASPKKWIYRLCIPQPVFQLECRLLCSVQGIAGPLEVTVIFLKYREIRTLAFSFWMRSFRLVQVKYLSHPKGVEPRPVAKDKAHILLIEPQGTTNTGHGDTAPVRREINRICANSSVELHQLNRS
jgi:hypothetical protein